MLVVGCRHLGMIQMLLFLRGSNTPRRLGEPCSESFTTAKSVCSAQLISAVGYSVACGRCGATGIKLKKEEKSRLKTIRVSKISPFASSVVR